MLDQQRIEAIKNYLTTYSGQFSEELLVDQLKKAGYTDEEIGSVGSLSEHAIKPDLQPQAQTVDPVGQVSEENIPVQASQPVEQPIQPVQEVAKPSIAPQEVQQQMQQSQFIEPQTQYQSPQMIGSDYMPGGMSNSKKPIIIAAASIIIIVLGVVGYGFWNGSNIKNFVKKAKGYNETMEGWETSFNPDFEKISKDADEILEELEKGAPGKAKRLHANLTDYFSHSKSLANSLKSIDKDDFYTSDLEDLVKKEDMDFAKNVDKVMDEIEEDIEKLEKVNFSF